MPQNFSVSVANFVGKTEQRSDALFRKVCLDLSRGVIMGTPVDTGRARGGWTGEVGVTRVDSGRLDPSGAATLESVRAVTERMHAGDKFYLANNVAYIVELEYGHSKQAPNGMLRTTLARFQSIVGEALVR